MSDREGYLKRRDQLLMQDEEIAELKAQIVELREEMTTRRKHAVKQIEVNDRILLKLGSLREAAGEAKDLLWKMQNVQPYSDEIHYVGALLNTALLLKEKE